MDKELELEKNLRINLEKDLSEKNDELKSANKKISELTLIEMVLLN